jgi:hypothetical protein
MDSNELDGTTEREERLRRLQAGRLPEKKRGTGAASSQSGQRAVAIRQGAAQTSRSSGGPPRKIELSDKAAHLIAKALKSMIDS